MIIIRMPSLPLERWPGRFTTLSDVSMGHDKVKKNLFELTRTKGILWSSSARPLLWSYRLRINMHLKTTHTAKLYIHSTKTAALFCPVTFRFFSLVLLVRPAKHRDHSFIALLELKSCFEKPLSLCRHCLDTQLLEDWGFQRVFMCQPNWHFLVWVPFYIHTCSHPNVVSSVVQPRLLVSILANYIQPLRGWTLPPISTQKKPAVTLWWSPWQPTPSWGISPNPFLSF